MKVLCIKSHGNFLVNIGQWYEVEEERQNGYMIYIELAGQSFNFYKYLFVTEKENRKRKLNKLKKLSQYE